MNIDEQYALPTAEPIDKSRALLALVFRELQQRLDAKGKGQYTEGEENAFNNFFAGAEMNRCHPIVELWHYMSKHIIFLAKSIAAITGTILFHTDDDCVDKKLQARLEESFGDVAIYSVLAIGILRYLYGPAEK